MSRKPLHPDKTTGKRLSRLPESSSYDIGYSKPPAANRFQKGQSGNPKGRPKGARNRIPALNEERLKTIILEEAYRTVKMLEGEKNVTIPIAQAVIRSLAVNAAKGNQRAQRLFAELLAATETANKRLYDEWVDTALTYKIEWNKELKRREALGIIAEDPIPHPDHIQLDMNTGQILITGPMTSEQKQAHEELRARKIEYTAEIAELEQMLSDDPDCAYRKFVEDKIRHYRKLVDKIKTVLPD